MMGIKFVVARFINPFISTSRKNEGICHDILYKNCDEQLRWLIDNSNDYTISVVKKYGQMGELIYTMIVEFEVSNDAILYRLRWGNENQN
jgi:hypothetical protein